MTGLVVMGLLSLLTGFVDPPDRPAVERRAREHLHVTTGRLVRPSLSPSGANWEVNVPGAEGFTLELAPVSLRLPGYRLQVQTADGVLTEVPAPAPQTYRGFIQGMPGSLAAVTVRGGELEGSVKLPDGGRLWIQPIAKMVAGAEQGDHLIYRGSDMLPLEQGVCGLQEIHAPPEGEGGVAGESEVPKASGGQESIAVVELACDADFEYFSHYGSVDAVQARIESVMNVVNMQYETEVGITHGLTALIVRVGEPDPYISLFSDSLLCQMITEWTTNQTGIHRDAAKLFTGRDIAGSILGQAANLGEICDNIGECLPGLDDGAYCYSQNDFNPSFACATDLAAHELGHLWNASHCFCPGTTMSQAPQRTNTFAPGSVQQILAYLPTVECDDVFFQLVWVDFDYVGQELGSEAQPFNSLSEGLAAVMQGGRMRIKAGFSDQGLTINQSVIIYAVGGPVTVGEQER